ncbi:hypothetical protein JCM3775_007251 [Rhodotorula graminis]|uniref:Opi1-domain-containing protein n=1 Tax=Rhodotorula graminis (strain WP1) TaxID=578459 RepID=A0A194SC41_RHOGW|nr:uncharacterized protein RHOBADRAFT_50538 [Rhodotorula graminis WP1]KPV78015.1 hypothetical protein RHOBADRAFT_50538 [Rhodotorula graminis WP1]
MAAASPAPSPNGGFAVPRSRRSARGGTSTSRAGPTTKGNTAAGDADGDEAMTDDMRIAVSALGLMREGGSAASASDGPPPTPAADADHSSTAQEHYAVPSLPSRYRDASSSRRSDPSRSTSTTSTASASETWTGATSDTGYSSPNGSASVAGTVGDTDMLGDGAHGEEEQGPDPRFMARVSQLPVVSSGIEWYERSKANSRVVKYGAGLVESSFSAVSRPVANALPPLGPLDDFACRQLDRIGAAGASPGRKSPSTALHPYGADDEAREQPHPHADGDDEMRRSARGGDIGPEFEPVSERALAERRSSASAAHDGQQVATVGGGAGRSRWQTVLLEAGGLGAAVSEESLKSLRYCLQWLLYATAHLDHQIGTLRDFILSLRAHTTSSSASSSSNALVAASASAHLAQIKHDVVETIRKVVDVMSKYAGAALPEQAKRYVRQCILGLPVKWASAIEGRAGGMSGRTTRESTVDGSELGTPRPERMGDAYFPGSGAGATGAGAGAGAAGQQDGEGAPGDEGTQDPALRPTEEAADRILTFAVESLDMLRSVTGIFSESVERAETWIERLRIVGLDRQRQQRDAADVGSDDGAMLPPALPPVGSAAYGDGGDDGAGSRTPTTGTKRRRSTPSSSALAKSSSTGSSVDAAESAAAVGATTAVEAGQAMDEGDEGVVTRRKRGAWRAEAAKSAAA